MKYNVKERTPNSFSNSTHIRDESGSELFTVWAKQADGSPSNHMGGARVSAYSHDQDEMYQRAQRVADLLNGKDNPAPISGSNDQLQVKELGSKCNAVSIIDAKNKNELFTAWAQKDSNGFLDFDEVRQRAQRVVTSWNGADAPAAEPPRGGGAAPKGVLLALVQ